MQHVAHQVPVTALAFAGSKLLLVGEGHYLIAYDHASQRAIAKVAVLNSQAVHGIVLDGTTAQLGLAWGGRFARFFELQAEHEEDFRIRFDQVLSLGDWILSAAFADSNANGHLTVAAVTAHSALWILRRPCSGGTERSDAAELQKVVPGSNSIRYCAQVKWLSASHCLIVSGTAFGDIIVWSAAIESDAERLTATSQTHYSFSAHAGSLFGVDMSTEMHLPGLGGSRRQLATCSDDRHIKIWDITNLNPATTCRTVSDRSTGFGQEQMPSEAAPPSIAQIMGHASRIWHVRFDRKDDPQSPASIWSFGEDACVLRWTIVPSKDASKFPYLLKFCGRLNPHAGKNIWAVAHTLQNLATGGADGSVAVIKHATVDQENPEHQQVHASGLENGDNLRAYCFVDDDAVLSTTERGRVVKIDISNATCGVDMIDECFSGLRNYSVVAEMAGTALFGGLDGIVYAFRAGYSNVEKILELGGKVAGLFTDDGSAGCSSFLATSVGSNVSVLAIFGPYEKSLRLQQHLELPLHVSSLVTSFAALQVDNVLYALTGTRNGAILIYAVALDEAHDTVGPCAVLQSIHGREAVTAIRLYQPQNSAAENCAWVFSTGRDGTMAVHRLTTCDEGVSMHLVHQLTLPFGPNVEGLRLSTDGQMQVWGFRSKHFVLYDVVGQREVMTVDCGGAHRNWALRPASTGGTFIWTKASKVYRYTQTALPYERINAGGHGRDIKATAMSRGSAGRQIIAMGAEDTNIKLFRVVNGQFRCLQTLRKHNTGIQHLQWWTDSRYLFSSGGFEEFFVWKVSHNVPSIDVGVVCESMHPRSGTSDLRIMGFEVQQRYVGKWKITMGYSDSTLKIWQYTDKIWTLLAAADYLAACLTHVIYCPASSMDVVTAATDGHIAMWHSREGQQMTLHWSARHRVHQNAIHAMALHTLSDGSTLLCTGGDDSAIGFTRIKDGQVATSLIASAHAAAVTGLTIIRRRSHDAKLWLASSSIDQRVKVWEVKIDCRRPGLDGLAVKLVQNRHTAVADVSGLEQYALEDGGRGLLVSGVGMDLWRLPEI